MKRIHTDHAAAGFSLIEVLVAQALLSLGLLSVAQLFGVAVYHGSYARMHALAATLARQKMEALGAQYAAGILPASGEDMVRIDNLDVGGGTDHLLAAFKVVWTVQPQPRGAYILQVKLIPWPGSAPTPSRAVWSPVMVFRAGLAPLRR